jgi:hypothetical protein
MVQITQQVTDDLGVAVGQINALSGLTGEGVESRSCSLCSLIVRYL